MEGTVYVGYPVGRAQTGTVRMREERYATTTTSYACAYTDGLLGKRIPSAQFPASKPIHVPRKAPEIL